MNNRGGEITYYKTFSQTGEYHKSIGKENEDAIKVVINGNYFYCVISDGAGCSKYAKEAAWCTVNAVADYCYNNGTNFFDSTRYFAAKQLVFDVQEALYNTAKDLNTELSQMMCTLVLLCINTDTLQYTTIHIGDGLIAKKSDDSVEIISYPHNGINSNITYFINDLNFIELLRVKAGVLTLNDVFIILSDGGYNTLNNNLKDIFAFVEKSTDDVSACCVSIDNDFQF